MRTSHISTYTCTHLVHSSTGKCQGNLSFLRPFPHSRCRKEAKSDTYLSTWLVFNVICSPRLVTRITESAERLQTLERPRKTRQSKKVGRAVKNKRVVHLVSKIELTFVSTPSLLLDVKALKNKVTFVVLFLCISVECSDKIKITR